VSDTKSDSLGPAPAQDQPIGELREYLARAYGLPPGYTVERVVRHGGRLGTALVVHIRAPGGVKNLVIRYEEERHCRSAASLRAKAVADTDGLTRGQLITDKWALSVYEALCALADVYERMDVEGQTWEWVQELYSRGQAITGLTLDAAAVDARYQALKTLKDYPYSRTTVQNPDVTRDGKVIRSVPPIFVDREDKTCWVTARHLHVFVKYDLGADVVEDTVFSRILEIGGKRRRIEQWNRGRTDKPRLVLFKLPTPAADDDPDAQDESVAEAEKAAE